MMFGVMDPGTAAGLGALELAYIGDCVFELYVRTDTLSASGKKVKELHPAVVKRVCAAGQAELSRQIQPILTEEEQAVFLRGRNHRHARIPKGSTPAEYALATGFEALMGFLYLCGRQERISELLKYCEKNTPTEERRV